MTMTSSSPTLHSTTSSTADLSASLKVIELKPGLKFSQQTLRDLIPDVETALFFGKVYELDAKQLGGLLSNALGHSSVVAALTSGDHSTELQSYVLDLTAQIPQVNKGDVSFDPTVPKGEVLPELWKAMQVEVAKSIKAVAAKLHATVEAMPGKQGQMLFRTMAQMNKRRPTIGVHSAHIHHAPQKKNLIVFDVSGSVSENTVRVLVDDVVALSYMADASFAIVSDTCTFWEPGTYSTQDVLDKAEYSGTHYETLAPLLDRDWGTVVSIADYDSGWDARAACANGKGSIDELLDVSLVNRPTFMAECLGQKAASVRPLLIGNNRHVLGSVYNPGE